MKNIRLYLPSIKAEELLSLHLWRDNFFEIAPSWEKEIGAKNIWIAGGSDAFCSDHLDIAFLKASNLSDREREDVFVCRNDYAPDGLNMLILLDTLVVEQYLKVELKVFSQNEETKKHLEKIEKKINEHIRFPYISFAEAKGDIDIHAVDYRLVSKAGPKDYRYMCLDRHKASRASDYTEYRFQDYFYDTQAQCGEEKAESLRVMEKAKGLKILSGIDKKGAERLFCIEQKNEGFITLAREKRVETF